MSITTSHRPAAFDEVIGQRRVLSKLEVKANVFKKNGTMPKHFIVVGAPGYGKTTVCQGFAQLMGGRYVEVMAPEIKGKSAIIDVFRRIRPNDVLFVDEIHALQPTVQETFYGVLEDFRMQAIAESGESYMKGVGPFTCIAATTHLGFVNEALKERFGRPLVLAAYSPEELAQVAAGIIRRKLKIELPEKMGLCIAALSFGVPRKVKDLVEVFIEYAEASQPTRELVSADLNRHVLKDTLIAEGIDPFMGLDSMARKYLRALIRADRPLGVSTIVQEVGEVEETLTRYVEPYLVAARDFNINGQVVKGPLINKFTRGRSATPAARLYLEGCLAVQPSGFFPDENLTLA